MQGFRLHVNNFTSVRLDLSLSPTGVMSLRYLVIPLNVRPMSLPNTLGLLAKFICNVCLQLYLCLVYGHLSDHYIPKLNVDVCLAIRED